MDKKSSLLYRLLICVAAIAAGMGAGLLVFFLVANSDGPPTPLLTGLNSPRGLTALDTGELLVAEVLGGKLLKVSAKGEVTVVLDGLPATLGGPSGDYPIGISAATFSSQTYHYVVGEPQHGGGVSRVTRYSSLYRAASEGTTELVAGGIGPNGFPSTRLTNPYDIVQATDGGFFVSDAGVNAVLHIAKGGGISDYAVFPDRHVTGPSGPLTMDAVPTGLSLGPDRALYLASFTGYPYPQNSAYVYRLIDLNSDGDAMDRGETAVFAEGFSVATDLVFEPDGALLVTEFSADMLGLIQDFGHQNAHEVTGRLVRWKDGAIEVVAEGLISPTSVAIVGDRIFVSEEFAGVVTEINPPRYSEAFAWSWAVAVGVTTAIGALAGVSLWRRARRRLGS